MSPYRYAKIQALLSHALMLGMIVGNVLFLPWRVAAATIGLMAFGWCVGGTAVHWLYELEVKEALKRSER